MVVQVLAEGVALTLAGSALGIALGLMTARYLDAILTSFPGLPAAFSFFVPRADSLALSAFVLLVTGSVAGLYPAWRRTGAHRRHASRRSDVTAPRCGPRSCEGLPDERGDRARAPRRLAAGGPG